MKNTIGIIGGMGPKATEYLYQLIIDNTIANKDQDHIDLIIINRASTPDRTKFILDNKKESPLPSIIRDIKILEKAGVSAFAVACNTSHSFAKKFTKETNLPFINMIEETVKLLKEKEPKKVGILSTTGTLKTKVYQEMLNRFSIDFFVPDEETQKRVMRVIYDEVKAGRMIDKENFLSIEESLIREGCDKAILGCTELSMAKNYPFFNNNFYIDSSEALARAIVREGGGLWQ